MKILFFIILVCTNAIVVNEVQAAARTLELEHTYHEIEGSSWRTDDAFRDAVNLPESEIPQLFRLPLLRARPFPVLLETSSTLSHVFINDTAFLYRDLNICLDRNLSIAGLGFEQAKEVFLSKLSGLTKIQDSNPLRLKLLISKIEESRPDLFKDCDVLVLQTRPGQFPFSRFEAIHSDLSARWAAGNSSQKAMPGKKQKSLPQTLQQAEQQTVPQIVLGLYYRYSEGSLPVIALNPKINLDFSGKPRQYLEVDKLGAIQVDGRSLLFHELGHVLGFSHVHMPSPLTLNPELSVMGIENSQRTSDQVDMRFAAEFDLWRHWDPQQTSVYRSLLWKWARGKMTSPGSKLGLGESWLRPYFCALPGETIDLRFRTFGSELESEPFSVLQNLPPSIDLRDPVLGPDLGGQETSRLKYQVVPGLDLRLSITKPAPSSVSFFTASHLLNSFYVIDKNSGAGFKPLFLQVSTLVGSIPAEALGKYRMSASFRIAQKYPGSYMPMVNVEVTPDPSQCYMGDSLVP